MFVCCYLALISTIYRKYELWFFSPNWSKINDNNCVYSSEPERNIQVAPLKYWVYKILKSEANFAETTTRFTIYWSSGNWPDIEKELETGVRLID